MVPNVYLVEFTGLKLYRSVSLLSYLVICLLSIFFVGSIKAQQTNVSVAKTLNYRQSSNPKVLDNYLYSTIYGADKKVYNLKGFAIAKLSKPVSSVRINPAGSTIAVLSDNIKTRVIEIYDANAENKKLYEFKQIKYPLGIEYSKDSKLLFITTVNDLQIYDSKSFQLKNKIDLSFLPSHLPQSISASNNGYHLAIIGFEGEKSPFFHSVYVLDIESGQLVSKLPIGKDIVQVSYSADGTMLGVLCYDEFIVYSSRNFSEIFKINFDKHKYSAFDFHPDGKYLCLATTERRFDFINLNDSLDRPFIIESDYTHFTKYVRFVKDGKQNIYLTYPASTSIKYAMIEGLQPNRSRMLREEILARMEEWSKIRDDETMEEYKMRVNDETRIRQAQLFEQEIATRMAEDYVMNSTVSLGGYNAENSMLTIEFDNMPTVYLSVPENEVTDFMAVENLEFKDAVYGLTKDDKFELIYANVYNKATGKSYEFNNLNRKPLDFLTVESEFVPIEIVQQSSLEEVKLNAIKRDIIEEAKNQKLISDHTNIQVSTGVISDYDAVRNKITNYKVAFDYSVDAKYSAYEDFPAGKYNINESHAAESMLKIVARAFETDFAQYIKAGKKVRVKITGSADAIPITGTIGYNGRYGEFVSEPCYIDNELTNITVTKKSGIKKNEQLAFVRAAAVKDYIQNNVTTLNVMNTDYQYYIELSNKRGGEYRRINVEFTFINAF